MAVQLSSFVHTSIVLCLIFLPAIEIEKMTRIDEQD